MVICSPTKRARIATLRDEGYTFTDIARKLGLDRSTVSRNWKKVRLTRNFYASVSKPGRPQLLTPHAIRRASRAITSGQARDASDVQRMLFPDVSVWTVRRALCSVGLKGRVRRKKPYLSRVHIRKRRIWAHNYRSWVKEDWRKVIYSDESKFNLFGSDGKQYCRRRPGEEFLPRNVQKVVKHGGGSVMVWGCISWNGTGRLHRVTGRMDAVQYCKILSESLLGTISDISSQPGDIIFQQDNDPKHSSRLAANWLQGNQIRTLPWPPSSPDLNIIEPLWDILDHAVRKRNPMPRNTDELWEALKEEWEKLEVGLVKRLYDSIPRRVAAVDKVRGNYTK